MDEKELEAVARTIDSAPPKQALSEAAAEHIRDMVVESSESSTSTPGTEQETKAADPTFLQKWHKRRMRCAVCTSSRWLGYHQNYSEWMYVVCAHCGHVEQFLYEIEAKWDGGWANW